MRKNMFDYASTKNGKTFSLILIGAAMFYCMNNIFEEKMKISVLTLFILGSAGIFVVLKLETEMVFRESVIKTLAITSAILLIYRGCVWFFDTTKSIQTWDFYKEISIYFLGYLVVGLVLYMIIWSIIGVGILLKIMFSFLVIKPIFKIKEIILK